MKWPERERNAPHGDTPHLWLDTSGRLEVSPDVVTQADARFEAVCAELGILLARRVEPVSARVLPFGTEQLAMVELRQASEGADHLHSATAMGASPAAAVAGAAINAVTGGRNVLSASLPGAVAEGKVRTAVVFGDGEAPVRWGLAGDEGRLAALYSVVPHLGSFTATTGDDTYRVLRLPGIGVALVSEGPSAAAWVEGWFAALLHATQFALRATQTPTDVVAASAPMQRPAEPVDESHALVMQRVEEESRRILGAAQEQAREIREAAERDAARAGERAPRDAGNHPSQEVDGDPWRRPEPEPRGAPSPPADARPPEPVEPPPPPIELETRREADELLREAERTRATLLAEAKREAESLLRETERARTTLLTDARREADGLLREAERARDKVLADTKRETEELLRDAERTRATLLSDAKRDAEGLLRETERARSTLLADSRRESEEMTREAERARREADQALRDAERARDEAQSTSKADLERQRRDSQRAADVLIGDARRVADDVIHEARRSADELVRDASDTRRRMLDEVQRSRSRLAEDEARARDEARDREPTRAREVDRRSEPMPTEAEPRTQRSTARDDTQSATAALLAAAAEAVSAMAGVVSNATTRVGAPDVEEEPTEVVAPAVKNSSGGLDDLPGLFFGA